MEKFYITTAIDYASDVPHFGHALEKTQADVIARYQRFLGKEVYFLSGSDEHGIKILKRAEARGKNVKDFVDENVEMYKKLAVALGISIDDFIRTTDKKRHWPGAQTLWKKLDDAGDIYKAKYKGYYCVGCEAYITEKELVGGKCQIHDKEPELIEEENYFFRISKYAQEIENKIKSDELKIIPVSRKNEALAMLGAGLEDMSFSRFAEKLNWGVPVPNDPSQIMYVWCDALANYVSALGYGSDDNNNFAKFWPADLHVIGKDISRFHAIVWPAMLLSAGLPLPKEILVHGFALSGGRKMSKTLGNVINPFDLIEVYGADAVRYYLLREITIFEDGDITEEKFKEAYNANLANGLGNLTARIMKMSEQYLQKSKIKNQKSKFLDEYKKFMDSFEINKAADFIWQKISDMDKKIQETEPFKLIKTEPGRAKEILSELVFGLKQIAEMLAPFLPETSEKILRAIEVNKMPEPLFLRK
jgi:methionyl-tRNA synthetase